MLIPLENFKPAAVIFYVLTMSTSLSCAEPGPRGGPPPEAIEACADLSERDVCSFTGRRNDTIEGTCIIPRNKEVLACAPEGSPPANHGRPDR